MWLLKINFSFDNIFNKCNNMITEGYMPTKLNRGASLHRKKEVIIERCITSFFILSLTLETASAFSF